MALFNFGKNKSENPSQEKIQVNGDYTIKVLGSGCKSCQTLFSNLQDAVKVRKDFEDTLDTLNFKIYNFRNNNNKLYKDIYDLTIDLGL